VGLPKKPVTRSDLVLHGKTGDFVKFEVGEIAIFIGLYGPECPWSYREEVEILVALPAGTPVPPPYNLRWDGRPTQNAYIVTCRGGFDMCTERCLAKRPQPGEQEQKFRETLKPCDKQFTKTLDRWLSPAPKKVKEKLH
jgi:hypothetical protein